MPARRWIANARSCSIPHDVARAVLLCASLQKGAMIPELQICPTLMRDTSADIETARWVGAPDDTPDKPKK